MNLIREIMNRPRPEKRIRIGRHLALVAIAIYCATRAIAYAPGLVGGRMEQVVVMVSLNGHILWVWAVAWGLAAVLCVADMIEGHTRRGMALAIGLGAAWGVAYAIAWVVAGIGGEWTTWWVTAINYLTLSVAIAGLLYKITAWQDVAVAASRGEDPQGG